MSCLSDINFQQLLMYPMSPDFFNLLQFIENDNLCAANNIIEQAFLAKPGWQINNLCQIHLIDRKISILGALLEESYIAGRQAMYLVSIYEILGENKDYYLSIPAMRKFLALLHGFHENSNTLGGMLQWHQVGVLLRKKWCGEKVNSKVVNTPISLNSFL